ncbi:DNA damage-regulated autophagy modulator protein 1-like [Dendronephthya gigantea]|uniref:DNA damage-regulated autophagy modulator protein 1-like n=1 Tax=Dendronephthya gigantea TaxID=151771 RepID=UPI00106A7527|nr:DNA damage-regulated autophagy modulator protein 1-like [Dendronephthya gigantea]
MFRRSCCTTDLLPVCFSGVLAITISISFVIAVARSDITPWFPAISDTATKSPESNVFSQLMNISTFVGFVLVYVRFLQVKRDVGYLMGSRGLLARNCWSLFFGLLAIFGASIVANFPETQIEAVHDVGAGIFFVFGNIYAWIQVRMSFYMKKFGLVSVYVCIVRTVVSVISTLSLLAFLILTSYAARLWDGNKFYWHSDDPGYTAHVVGNAFEWVLVFNFLILVLTFTKELCNSRLEIKLVGYRDNYEPIPVST